MTKKQFFKLLATLAIVPGGFIMAAAAIAAALLLVLVWVVVAYGGLLYLAAQWCCRRIGEGFRELLHTSGRKREGREIGAESASAPVGPGLSEKPQYIAESKQESRWLQ